MKIKFEVDSKDEFQTIFSVRINGYASGALVMDNTDFQDFIEIINLGLATKNKDSITKKFDQPVEQK